ncbi:MAG: nitroreductase [Novosphingobium sp.]|nr:nitroreductase [Novosphingobium sp.]
MKVTEAVQTRHSVRAFLGKPVDETDLRDILEIAARAPSGGNLQPWQVYALTGAALAELKATVKDKLERGERESGDYVIYPPKLWEPLRSRRREAGALRYAALGVGREENGEALLEDMNFGFFGAPVGLFFCLDRRVGPPQWSDLGMYMQTLMLLAVERGLATCPQEIWSVWPQTVARVTGMPEELLLFAGMSLGYEDTSSPMNSYRTEREPLESFATFLGFE